MKWMLPLLILWVTVTSGLAPKAAAADASVSVVGGELQLPKQCGSLGDPAYVQQLVTLLYEGALFREPDPAGLYGWTSLVLRDGYQGLLNVSWSFGRAPETRRVLAWNGPQVMLDNLYGVFFHRAVDVYGENAWLPLLYQGRPDDVLRALVGSDEFTRDYFYCN